MYHHAQLVPCVTIYRSDGSFITLFVPAETGTNRWILKKEGYVPQVLSSNGLDCGCRVNVLSIVFYFG
jgi:hypothetical protein